MLQWPRHLMATDPLTLSSSELSHLLLKFNDGFISPQFMGFLKGNGHRMRRISFLGHIAVGNVILWRERVTMEHGGGGVVGYGWRKK